MKRLIFFLSLTLAAGPALAKGVPFNIGGPPGNPGLCASLPFLPFCNPVTPPVTPPVEPPVVPSESARPAQPQDAARQSRPDYAGMLAFYIVAQHFLFAICEKEGWEICKAPEWMRGPMDDRFDDERYGAQ